MRARANAVRRRRRGRARGRAREDRARVAPRRRRASGDERARAIDSRGVRRRTARASRVVRAPATAGFRGRGAPPSFALVVVVVIIIRPLRAGDGAPARAWSAMPPASAIAAILDTYARRANARGATQKLARATKCPDAVAPSRRVGSTAAEEKSDGRERTDSEPRLTADERPVIGRDERFQIRTGKESERGARRTYYAFRTRNFGTEGAKNFCASSVRGARGPPRGAEMAEWTASIAALSISLFIIAGFLEVGGGWLVWQAVREVRPRFASHHGINQSFSSNRSRPRRGNRGTGPRWGAGCSSCTGSSRRCSR